MDIFKNACEASLVLQDGSVYEGLSVGSKQETIGELVFNTSVVGFQEILTDPANSNHIVIETFPLVGNYGVNHENNLSEKTTAKGWVVREWCDQPSNFRSEGRIDKWLEEKNITAIFDLDTRAITRKIRTSGAMLAMITTQKMSSETKTRLLQTMADYKRPLPAWKENKEIAVYEEKESPASFRITVVDYGVRNDVIQALVKRGCRVTVVPSAFTEQQIRKTNPDGIVLCGGTIHFDSIEGERETVEMLMRCGFPLLGIDFGHQLMGLCCGGIIEKMPNGHRGANCPVTDLATGKTFITTQNHGYVLREVYPNKARLSHLNTNDKSCEGLRYLDCSGMSVQFIPDCELGRKNFDGIYEAFLSMVQEKKNV